MRDDERQLLQDTEREAQKARSNEEKELNKFRRELKEGGEDALRNLEANIQSGRLQRERATAAQIAVREYREDQQKTDDARLEGKDDNRYGWESLRSWLAICISIVAVLVAWFKP